MEQLFMDTEFTGLHKNTTLISLALVGDKVAFHAELTDYDQSQVNDWIQKNVIDQLVLGTQENLLNSTRIFGGDFDFNGVTVTSFRGTKEELSKVLKSWFYANFLNENSVEIISDVLAFDWVLFCDIFGSAFEIPKEVYYIPRDLSSLYKDSDFSRWEFVREYKHLLSPSPLFESLDLKSPTNQQHSAWFDAIIIKACYEIITKLKNITQ